MHCSAGCMNELDSLPAFAGAPNTSAESDEERLKRC